MSNEEKRKDFEAAAKPLLKFLNDNYNPHTTVIVTPTGAEVLSGELVFDTTEFVKD